MTQINIQDAGLELSPPPNRRIGVAEGKFTVPDDFDLWDIGAPGSVDI